jgi:pimeloyl-ACP methyl ester carboxylesterase
MTVQLAPLEDVQLAYEDTGHGAAVVFSHEFAGDLRSWEPQVRALARRYRCVTYNHRGFPPSSVPDEAEAYSERHLVVDLLRLMDHLRLERAHIVGHSMGASVALNFALLYPERCSSVVIAGAGTGTTNRARFEADVAAVVDLIQTQGIERFAEVYAVGPSRLPFRRKDPKGWSEFRTRLTEHSATGQALTMLGVQLRRPTIFDLGPRLQNLRTPALIVVGDEDEPCIDPSVFMKRQIPCVGLAVFPQTGHTLNLEEPDLFNRLLIDFFSAAESNDWSTRGEVSTALITAEGSQ